MAAPTAYRLAARPPVAPGWAAPNGAHNHRCDPKAAPVATGQATEKWLLVERDGREACHTDVLTYWLYNPDNRL